MTTRVSKQKPAPQEKEPQTPHSEGGEQADLEYTDELMDSIDGLLEENAEAFVRNFIQKGGQ